MAQIPYEPSGSAVSKAESDIAQTISLAGSIITLVREPISLVLQNIAKGRGLKRSLGAWQAEAIDDGGQCRIPMIRKDEFEKHLVDIDGVVQTAPKEAVLANPLSRWDFTLSFSGGPKLSIAPGFPSSGTACWGYLLYALGVFPGRNVVDWRPSTDGFVNTQNGGIELEIDGAAVCHIINLYSALPEASSLSVKIDRRQDKRCKFAFGELAWDVAGDQFHAHFAPGSERALASAKRPFGFEESKMDPGIIIASYLTALLHTVSDPEYKLASPKAPLPERIDRLLDCMRKFKDRLHRGPLFISYDWFKEASRVKRRALAQGGSDHSFFEDIVKTIRREPYVNSYNRATLGEDVRRKFLLNEEGFTVWVQGSEYNSDPADFYICPVTAQTVCEKTLLGYEGKPPGSWKRGLFEMREKVLALLNIPHEVFFRQGMNAWYIEFTRTCEVWQKTVLLGAPGDS